MVVLKVGSSLCSTDNLNPVISGLPESVLISLDPEFTCNNEFIILSVSSWEKMGKNKRRKLHLKRSKSTLNGKK